MADNEFPQGTQQNADSSVQPGTQPNVQPNAQPNVQSNAQTGFQQNAAQNFQQGAAPNPQQGAQQANPFENRQQGPYYQGSAYQNPNVNNYQSGHHDDSAAQTGYQQQRAAYGYNPDNGQTGKGPSQTLAIIGMITGICSILFCCVAPLAIILGIAALICSIFAMKKGQNKGMWLTGIITGAIGLLISLIVLILVIVVIGDAGSGLMGLIRHYMNGGGSTIPDGDLSNIIQQFTK
ncbi:MAG: DUF4190 domain-containing protein [Lachnospiraceae bacterium]|jgi:hypothetical protein|nr:DUF4190 domain-containing protein [Lachnospiraceae bacterium]